MSSTTIWGTSTGERVLDDERDRAGVDRLRGEVMAVDDAPAYAAEERAGHDRRESYATEVTSTPATSPTAAETAGP